MVDAPVEEEALRRLWFARFRQPLPEVADLQIIRQVLMRCGVDGEAIDQAVRDARDGTDQAEG